MHRLTSWTLIGVVTAAGAIGCRHTCCKRSASLPPAPPPGAPIIVPQPQPRLVPPTPEVLPPAPPPPSLGAPAPPPATPTPAGYPPIAKADAVPPTVRLLPPELGESVTQAAATEPAPAATAPSPPLPVGIPDFASAIDDKVANGRKPLLDGLDWLKSHGYRGALLIRKPGEIDTADRSQFESRGLTFVSLEVSLQQLDRATVDHFNRLVSDAGRHPLFVYDTDGSLTGSMWYLYFRRVERLDDAAARAKAERLGLKYNDRDQRLAWLAIQDFLAKNP